MSYTILLRPRAVRDHRRLPRDVRSRIAAALLNLEDDPRPPGCLKMADSGEWRIRVGEHRIRYLIDDAAQEVTVMRIGHRRDVYNS